MATGDLAAVAQHIARQVGIERVIARATPAMKLELIHQLQQQGKRVGMIGDGINDAPALTAADVGLAFGAGTLPSMLSASFLFGRLGVRTRGWLLKGAALFVIVLGIATVWQGIRYYLVMRTLLG